MIPPLPWTIAAIRSTGAELTPRVLQSVLRGGGQAPFFPPNVSGWPSGEAWLTSSATTTRLEAARVIADVADADGSALAAAHAGDLAELARTLGRPRGFSATTRDALQTTGERGRTLLALALATPDLVVT